MVMLAKAVEPLARRMLLHLPPETAHKAAVQLMSMSPSLRRERDPRLATQLAGRKLSHPIGIAAGFDKTARILDGMAKLDFSFIEVGTVTPRPQAGNPSPRVFRLPEDEALINRFGFNNDGLDDFVMRMADRPRELLIGANIGINKDCTEPLADFALGLERCDTVADYVTINVSSPNTPGLRDLQDPKSLQTLLAYLRENSDATKPLFLKLAPDLEDGQLLELVDVAIGAKLAGLILCNTTTARPDNLKSINRDQGGGLSGLPLRSRSKSMLRQVAKVNRGRLELISAGGLSDGTDLFERLAAGASAVQIYTAFIYQGPAIIDRMCDDLLRSMDQCGVADVAKLIGRDVGKT